MFTHIRRLVAEEYSSANALDLTAGIHRHDRWSTFDQYRRSGEYCAARLREEGVDRVRQQAGDGLHGRSREVSGGGGA